MKNITIKRFDPKDFDVVIEFLEFVITDTFTKEGIGDLKDDIKEEVDSKAKYLNQDIKSDGTDRFFLIAKLGETIVGTIEHGPTNDLIIENTNGELDDLGMVGTIYVHTNYQKQGIGSALLLKMMSELKNRSINEYCLDTGYEMAHIVWTRMFGKPLYTLKDYWGEGGHHSIWRISIDDTINKLSN